jgi:DNA-binding LacI/PurR family transcriptional regulator
MADKSISGGFFNVGVSQSGSWNKMFNRIYREHYPFVMLDAPLKVGALPSVGSNLFRIGFRAAELLYRYGKRAAVCGYRNVYDYSLRTSGFLAGCEAFNWAVPLEFYTGPETDYQVTEELFDNIFTRYRGEFDTIFTSTRGHTVMLAKYLLNHPELVPGRDFNWIGADSQKCFPEQGYMLDVLAQQSDLLAAAAFDVMEKAMAQRGSGVISSVYVDALYHSGNTVNRSNNP